MKRTTFTLAAVVGMIATVADAQSIEDQVISQLTAQGYSRIEVQTGPSQVKVEAIRGNRELEVVYDAVTGAVLKQEVNAVFSDDDTAPGIERRTRDRDFVRASGSRDDDSDDDDREDRADDRRDRADDLRDRAEDRANDRQDRDDDRGDRDDDRDDDNDDDRDDENDDDRDRGRDSDDN